MLVEVGATYDATIADTNNLHRRVILIAAFSIGAAAIFAWLLATFAVRPFKRVGATDPGPSTRATRIHRSGVRGRQARPWEIAEAMRGMLQRIWDEQNRTIEALASARDFAGRVLARVCAHR